MAPASTTRAAAAYTTMRSASFTAVPAMVSDVRVVCHPQSPVANGAILRICARTSVAMVCDHIERHGGYRFKRYERPPQSLSKRCHDRAKQLAEVVATAAKSALTVPTRHPLNR